jgi:hypothetical protein
MPTSMAFRARRDIGRHEESLILREGQHNGNRCTASDSDFEYTWSWFRPCGTSSKKWPHTRAMVFIVDQ